MEPNSLSTNSKKDDLRQPEPQPQPQPQPQTSGSLGQKRPFPKKQNQTDSLSKRSRFLDNPDFQNSQPTTQPSTSEEADDRVVTLGEILAQEQALEEEATAQLQGDWGDERACTYGQGYHSQPVYSCKTCLQTKKQNSQDESELFGMCFGCSMNCHVDHEIFELFEKRDFRCDCGTSSCPIPCSLQPASETRETRNQKNHYDHNFEGLYCWCNQQYDEKTEMIQCYICQDWFHVDCIEERLQAKKNQEEIPQDNEKKKLMPDLSDFQTFICDSCSATRFSFVLSSSGTFLDHRPFSTSFLAYPTERKESQASSSEQDPKRERGCLFLKKGWKKSICKCQNCLSLFQNHCVSFLEDKQDEDTDGDEEEDEPGIEGSEKSQEGFKNSNSIIEETTSQLLQSIPSVVDRLELIYRYNTLSDRLKAFLAPFAQSGVAVTKEDIEGFFAQLNQSRNKPL
eukprot:TRINITY_DN5853_c0_g1_i1.p1 TRINITY_DN5853_c0_g1~~TRINITY_DN5853_c0_g1_i1.p1  ORF type:complete len:454 (-),score=102.23 TRINITY_DN5853_c0_g1_i1:60-1421(-)